MADHDRADSSTGELRARIGETSLRMMAGVVPGHVVEHLQARLYAEPDDYPWQEVVDTVLTDSVSDEDALNKGILAHRNWLLRSGRDAPVAATGAPQSAGGGGGARRRSPSMKVRGKTMVASLLVKGGFFLIYTLAIVLLLVLLRLKFPSLNIYELFGGLNGVFPGSGGN